MHACGRTGKSETFRVNGPETSGGKREKRGGERERGTIRTDPCLADVAILRVMYFEPKEYTQLPQTPRRPPRIKFSIHTSITCSVQSQVQILWLYLKKTTSNKCSNLEMQSPAQSSGEMSKLPKKCNDDSLESGMWSMQWPNNWNKCKKTSKNLFDPLVLFDTGTEKWWNETTTSLLGRYNDTCSPVECWKTNVLTDTRPKNQLLWIVALSFSARPFTGDAIRGIIVSRYRNS